MTYNPIVMFSANWCYVLARVLSCLDQIEALKWIFVSYNILYRHSHGGKTWSCEECSLWCFNYCNVYNTRESMKNALFGVVYIAIVKTPKIAFFI